MREIKFRAWDMTSKKMWEPEFLEDLWTGNRYETKRDLPRYPSCQIMQFTGLKDKNGKEIWEGDVVRYATETYHTSCPPKNVVCLSSGIISWYKPRAGFEIETLKPSTRVSSIFMLGSALLPYLEVLGNIYENTELLKEAKDA